LLLLVPTGQERQHSHLRYLPEIAGCRNFVNVDLIAYGLSPLDSLSAQYEAGRIFLREIHSNIDKKVDFAFETTLAGRSQISLFKRLKKDDWQIILFFLWIPNMAFSKSRIRERVKHGGHDIPDGIIFRRFPRVMHNFTKTYIPLCDKVLCYDNSMPEPVLIFRKDSSGLSILNQDRYAIIMRWYSDYKANQ
jgi:predicted ABC-type ATPase